MIQRNKTAIYMHWNEKAQEAQYVCGHQHVVVRLQSYKRAIELLNFMEHIYDIGSDDSLDFYNILKGQ